MPNYLESDGQRKCRNCGDSKNYRRSTTYAKITECTDGVTVITWVRSDATAYRCLSCGEEVTS